MRREGAGGRRRRPVAAGRQNDQSRQDDKKPRPTQAHICLKISLLESLEIALLAPYAEYEEVATAVTIDEGTGSQAHDGTDTGSSLAPSATGTGATMRQKLAEEEHRLVDEGRELVERAREHLDEEVRKLRDEERRVAEGLKVSTPGKVWARLSAVDFMTSSMQFAALAVLVLFPFLVIVAAETGKDARPALIRRLGLTPAAAKDINNLMSTGTHAAATLNVIGAALVILGAIGIASTLQAWYQKVYDQQNRRSKWTRQVTAQFIWLVGLLIYLGLQDLLGRELAHVGTRVPGYAVFFLVCIAFYWWTQHILLLGRVGWGQLFPAALATSVAVTGLGVFSAFLFSGQIVSGDADYGSIGVVTVLLSYLIGLGVCLHLGAVTGYVWNEQRTTVPQPQETNKPSD
jgi:membrane protein